MRTTYLANKILALYIICRIDDPPHETFAKGTQCHAKLDNYDSSRHLISNLLDNITMRQLLHTELQKLSDVDIKMLEEACTIIRTEGENHVPASKRGFVDRPAVDLPD